MHMKTVSPTCLLTFLLFSCNLSSTKEQHTTGIYKPAITDSTVAISSLQIDTAFRLKLVPLEIVDSSSHDVYKKFGISTSGMCYECDLANISIANGKIHFSNICDPGNSLSYEINRLVQNGQTTAIRFKEVMFVLEKINQVPVYRLQLENTLKPGERLKLKEYYSSEADIKKFEIHDCGDFEG